MKCKINITAASDKPYWIRWVDFKKCVDEKDLACRESEIIKDCYLSAWFLHSDNDDCRFTLPAFYLRDGRARFINGRHRTLLLSRHLDVLPMALTQTDQHSQAVLDKIVDREIGTEEVITLPDLPILEVLRKEEAGQRAMFKSERLQDSFPSVLNYYFEKIYESIHGSKPAEIGSMHVKLIADIIESFKNQLKKRGVLNVYLFDLLEYPIEQLSLYFTKSEASILDNRGAYIFVFFVEKHIDELKKIAEEIDTEYESEP